jgi:hypothetical protein
MRTNSCRRLTRRLLTNILTCYCWEFTVTLSMDSLVERVNKEKSASKKTLLKMMMEDRESVLLHMVPHGIALYSR